MNASLSVFSSITSYNPLDVVFLAGFAAAFFFGYRRGFVLQLVSLASVFVAWIAAYLFYDDIVPWVERFMPLEAFSSYTRYEFFGKEHSLTAYAVSAIAFILIFFLVRFGLGLAGHMLNLLTKVPGLNLLNRWSGAALAVFETIVLAAVLVQLLALLPMDSVQALLGGSRISGYLMELIPSLVGKIKELPVSTI